MPGLATTDPPAFSVVGNTRSLAEHLDRSIVLTAAYLYTDLDAKIVRYRGAGHPPLLLSSRSNDDARSIEQNGLFLGMFPEAAYSSLEIPLRPGDRYVLYTDGQPESRNAAGEEFGPCALQAISRVPSSSYGSRTC